MEKDEQKRIDEAWKDAVGKEKSKQKEEPTQQEIPHYEPTFQDFISSLGLQTLILLGEVANPATGKKEKNLEQARFVIDTLGMLKEKTKSNLTAEETTVLDDLLYSLRMRFIDATKTK